VIDGIHVEAKSVTHSYSRFHSLSMELIWGLLVSEVRTAVAFYLCVTLLHHSLVQVAKFPIVLSFSNSIPNVQHEG
jgi:hypothetical protein